MTTLENEQTRRFFDEFPEMKAIARLINRYLDVRGVNADGASFRERLAITVALMETDRTFKEKE